MTTNLLWLVSFALLAARVSDAHVHLCFDGQEPRSSLHVSQHEPICHTSDERRGDHQDQDVDIDAASPLLVKKDFQGDGVAPIAPAEISLLLLPPDRGARPALGEHRHQTQHPHSFLPPLRGPPV